MGKAFPGKLFQHQTQKWSPDLGENRPISTSHISVIDEKGRAVSMTTSIGSAFGSRIMVRGFMLNNELTDFAARPKRNNYLKANRAKANKRPRSSMAPTIITDHLGKLEMVIGSPGGPRIITTVVQVIINVIDFGMEIQAAIDAPRLHHQWKPDRLRLEKTFATDIEKLSALGHQVNQNGTWSAAHGIVFDAETGKMYGGADYRIVDGTVLGW